MSDSFFMYYVLSEILDHNKDMLGSVGELWSFQSSFYFFILFSGFGRWLAHCGSLVQEAAWVFSLNVKAYMGSTRYNVSTSYWFLLYIFWLLQLPEEGQKWGFLIWLLFSYCGLVCIACMSAGKVGDLLCMLNWLPEYMTSFLLCVYQTNVYNFIMFYLLIVYTYC